MVDMAEEVGKRVCAELQKEFSPNDVMFIRTDVTQSEQLVSPHSVEQVFVCHEQHLNLTAWFLIGLRICSYSSHCVP